MFSIARSQPGSCAGAAGLAGRAALEARRAPSSLWSPRPSSASPTISSTTAAAVVAPSEPDSKVAPKPARRTVRTTLIAPIHATT